LNAVHPLQPRFAQALTGVLTLEAIVFDTPAAVAVALALVLLSLAGPRWSPVAWVFRRIAPPAGDLEPAAPVRFSQFLAAGFLALSLALLVAGATLAGWIVAGMVAALALVSALSGFCVGCEVYRLALRLRDDGEGDVRSDLGLAGAGPWLVVLTAPGCARCEPFAVGVERCLLVDEDNVPKPDVVVYDKRDLDVFTAECVPIEKVALVVEVVSPGSRQDDRVRKPAMFAAAKVPYYWRVERGDDGLPVVHELWLHHDLGMYVPAPEHPCHIGKLATDLPFPVTIDLHSVLQL